MTNFKFLEEWNELHKSALEAEKLAFEDPRVSSFHSRRTLELIIQFMYEYDQSLILPYQTHLAALIFEPTFRDLVEERLFNKAKIIKDIGNKAVHSKKIIKKEESIFLVKELFHFSFWFSKRYSGEKISTKPLFNELFLESKSKPKNTDLSKLKKSTKDLSDSLIKRSKRLVEVLKKNTELNEEIKKLRSKFSKNIEENNQIEIIDKNVEITEDETRKFYIDKYLEEAGWDLSNEGKDTEYEVKGMPNSTGIGFVDYVLWGDDGKPLGLVEAKRASKDPNIGRKQAALYADCLEKKFNQRPIIFYSNGYDHYIWDDKNYPPRKVSGFYKKDELELLIQRRVDKKSISGSNKINQKIVDRPYQIEAISRVTDLYENKDRKSLLVMATGSGKTRTAAAIIELLINNNWVKRVLFLADRRLLVSQAEESFKEHLKHSSIPICNLLEERDSEARVFVSTYPTMMNMIDETNEEDNRRFGPGYFDLIIIDEAHRSVFQKYQNILRYFDSLLLGLTATPKDEIDRNTYNLFDLENKVPTYEYSLDQAVKDKYLVPFKADQRELGFVERGVAYDELSDEEKEQYENEPELRDENGDLIDFISPDEVNKKLMNQDTIDLVLKHLMENGQKIKGGNVLGKTIIFAQNQVHARFIEERFDKNYPEEKGRFASVITYETPYAEKIKEEFSNSEKYPNIAISVDMLDTGIDIPDVVNLVFFRSVKSKVKFWQMIGRGTRLREDLFGPGIDKKYFSVFDFGGNIRYFTVDHEDLERDTTKPLGQRIFNSRLKLLSSLGKVDLIDAFDNKLEPKNDKELKKSILNTLMSQVMSMNKDNFIVRLENKNVEKYQNKNIWKNITSKEIFELEKYISKLPDTLERDKEEALRFDYLILGMQIELGDKKSVSKRKRNALIKICKLLEKKMNIPIILEQKRIILEVIESEWWENVSRINLERVRINLRDLVYLIDKKDKKIIYSDFQDEMDEGIITHFGDFDVDDFSKYKKKLETYLQEKLENTVIYKLKNNIKIDSIDLENLEKILNEIDKGNTIKAKQEHKSLGTFVRSIIGLDKIVVDKLFVNFLGSNKFNSNQINFINMIKEHIHRNGLIDKEILFEQPFISMSSIGPDGILENDQKEALYKIFEEIESNTY